MSILQKRNMLHRRSTIQDYTRVLCLESGLDYLHQLTTEQIQIPFWLFRQFSPRWRCSPRQRVQCRTKVVKSQKVHKKVFEDLLVLPHSHQSAKSRQWFGSFIEIGYLSPGEIGSHLSSSQGILFLFCLAVRLKLVWNVEIFSLKNQSTSLIGGNHDSEFICFVSLHGGWLRMG